VARVPSSGFEASERMRKTQIGKKKLKEAVQLNDQKIPRALLERESDVKRM
jgi:hypothetical protein